VVGRGGVCAGGSKAGGSPSGSSGTVNPKVGIYFGTQTGTAEQFATDLQTVLQKHFLVDVEVRAALPLLCSLPCARESRVRDDRETRFADRRWIPRSVVHVRLYPLCSPMCVCGYTLCALPCACVAIPSVLSHVRVWLYPLCSPMCVCGYTLCALPCACVAVRAVQGAAHMHSCRLPNTNTNLVPSLLGCG
jgi:hypothetical protein